MGEVSFIYPFVPFHSLSQIYTPHSHYDFRSATPFGIPRRPRSGEMRRVKGPERVWNRFCVYMVKGGRGLSLLSGFLIVV